MTREQAKQNLIAIGVSEPTDEQISNYLNQLNGETKEEKEKVAELKSKADEADGLRAKLDEIEAGNLSEIEKANRKLQEANEKIAKLQKDNAIRDQREAAMSNFKIDAEQAKTVVKDDGSIDYESLGKIISDKEKAAVADIENKLLDGTPNPNGGSAGGGSENEKPADVKNAESITFGSNAPAKEEADYYKI